MNLRFGEHVKSVQYNDVTEVKRSKVKSQIAGKKHISLAIGLYIILLFHLTLSRSLISPLCRSTLVKNYLPSAGVFTVETLRIKNWQFVK